jgi:hypothetical protein
MKKQIPLNKWFQLPWLGQDVFPRLMRAGVKHDKRFGFKITAETDAQRALSIIASAIGQEVEIERECAVCGNGMTGREIAGATVCQNCVQSEDAFDLYTMKFASMMDAI